MTSLILSQEPQKDFELAPAGNHIARCYEIVDLGYQEKTWKGETKRVRQIRIRWELPQELMEDGRPFSVKRDYTLSFNEKSNLYQDLISWRGRAFTDDELKQFNLFNVMGAPAMVNVVHRTADNGRTYANVGSIGPLPKGMTCPDMINDPVEFSLDDYSQEAWDKLPEWLQNRISRDDIPTPEPTPEPKQEDFPDDDIPF